MGTDFFEGSWFGMTRAEWVRSQIRSPWHWGSMLALWGLGYYTLGWAGRGHMTAAMAGWGLFLLVETAPMLWTMLAFAGAMLFLSRIFPPAAIIFIIIGIVFFILRIRYVIQNAQLLASGFLVYLVYYYLFADHMRLGGKLVEVCYRLLTLGHLIVPPWPLRQLLIYPTLLLAAGLPVLLVHLFLWMAYRKGYESRNALTVLFGLPLVVISFLLPFLKILGAFDGAAFSDTGHTGHLGGDGVHGTGEGYVPADGHPVPVHHVNGYIRSTPGGGTTYVHPHVATNPDGILENNLSYHGPHPAPVSAGVPHTPAGTGHPVHGPNVDTVPGVGKEENK